MSEPTRIYYRASSIVPNYLGGIALVVLGLWSPFPTTYLGFLKVMPGRLLIYACGAILIFALLRHLPTFFRALFRIPAVELTGDRLLIRGWEDRTFETGPRGGLVVRMDEDRQLILLSAPGRQPARIHTKLLQGPRTVATFLTDLAAGG